MYKVTIILAGSVWRRTIAHGSYPRYRCRVRSWTPPVRPRRQVSAIPRRSTGASMAVAITSKTRAGVVRWPRTPESSSPSILMVRIQPAAWSLSKPRGKDDDDISPWPRVPCIRVVHPVLVDLDRFSPGTLRLWQKRRRNISNESRSRVHSWRLQFSAITTNTRLPSVSNWRKRGKELEMYLT